MSGVLPAIQARLMAALPDATVELARAPDKPNELLLLREYPAGAPRDLDGASRASLERHSIQVLARAISVADAETLAWRAYRALPARHHVSGGGVIDWIIANHTPHHIGFDQNDRALVVCNYTLQRWGDLGYVIARAAVGSVTVTGNTPSVTGGGA